MIKTKIFYRMQYSEGEEAVNQWLSKNSDICILSTNSFSNQSEWGYIILYDDYKPQHSTLPLKEGEVIYE